MQIEIDISKFPVKIQKFHLIYILDIIFFAHFTFWNLFQSILNIFNCKILQWKKFGFFQKNYQDSTS